MGLMYHYARFPDDRELVAAVAAAGSRLHDKLAALAAERLDISDYNKHYLRRYQEKLHSNLQKFAYILSWALAGADKPLADTVLLDYGGGAGILSMLARESGVGTVIYNDIYDVSCVDAETVGVLTGTAADYYVCGDVRTMTRLLESQSLSCDVMVSSDVIEHIYDMGAFFRNIRDLSHGHLSIAMSSHANPRNPVVRRLLTRKQVQVEREDRAYAHGHKKRDNLRSYLRIREDIARECGGGVLSETETAALARRTRGMIDADIRASVARYIETGELPPPIDHPTNTCDPYTGNWADRLLDPREIGHGFARAGFRVDILSGFYGRPNGLVKRVLARLLDLAIAVTNGKSLRLAPFFLIHGSGDMSLYKPRRAAAGAPAAAREVEPAGVA
ncbi:MAG: methyltransferase domain-containing protein [Candidatus Krumholzibacteriia bacterium]